MTLFDIRFARDSIFERVCKAMQLVAMVGFASAGSRFTTRVRDENVWAFQALSALLAGSRLMLAVQYMINIGFLHKKMRMAAKGMFMIAVVLSASSFSYTGVSISKIPSVLLPCSNSRGQLYFAMSPTGPYIWTVWFGLFLLETLVVMGVSGYTPGLGFEDTHLNVRMALLTLMIIGEAAMSVTRIVNKMVGPGGWTSHSFVHILGVTITVVRLPCFRLSCITNMMTAVPLMAIILRHHTESPIRQNTTANLDSASFSISRDAHPYFGGLSDSRSYSGRGSEGQIFSRNIRLCL